MHLSLWRTVYIVTTWKSHTFICYLPFDVACVTVISVTFEPSERRTRAFGEKGPTFLLLFAQCPRASFVLAPLGSKETKTTATQATFDGADK